MNFVRFFSFMIGIYKIICQATGKIYIGQSIDLVRRMSSYTRMSGSTYQIKLHRSRIKYGIESHTIEVVEECSIDMLNERERYWQDFHDACGKKGLNCILTKTNSKSGKMSDETKAKISSANKGRVFTVMTQEVKNKISNALTGLKHSKERAQAAAKRRIGNKSRTGQKLSPHEIEIIRKRATGNKYNLGRKATEETKIKMSAIRKGTTYSDEHKKNISIAKQRGGHHLARKVINIIDGTVYQCGKDAAESIGMNYSTFHNHITGYVKNKTPFRYV